jgi:hypothetical protein
MVATMTSCARTTLKTRYEGEWNSVRAIVEIIDDGEEQQTSELVKLEEVQRRLVTLLKGLDPIPKQTFQEFADQLIQDYFDESRLANITTSLGQFKSMVLLRTQVVNVGVMRNMDKRLVELTQRSSTVLTSF